MAIFTGGVSQGEFKSNKLILIFFHISQLLISNILPILSEIGRWLIAASTEFFKANVTMNFGLIAVLVKVDLEITKKAPHLVLRY